MSTGGNGAAAGGFYYPEKLGSRDREAAGELLHGNPRGQDILDELEGMMRAGKARDPMALLVSFIRKAHAGDFACSYAPRIQAEREGRQVTAEVEKARAEGRHA